MTSKTQKKMKKKRSEKDSNIKSKNELQMNKKEMIASGGSIQMG